MKDLVDKNLSKHANGVYYTSDELADYLLSRTKLPKNGSVLDPACGGMALLRATRKKYGKSCDCSGVDIANQVSDAGFVKFLWRDFFVCDSLGSFDLVVTNPPYVRGSLCGMQVRKWFVEDFADKIELSNRADLWAYFVLKSVGHLRVGGDMAAILPWSFFTSDYSKPIRKFLSERFHGIDVHVISQAMFVDTPQKVVLVWMYGKGSPCRRYRVMCSAGLEKRYLGDFCTISKCDFLIGAFRGNNRYYHRHIHENVYRLGELCDVKIGCVPGATKFFVRSRKEMREINAEQSDMARIITSSRALSSLNISTSTAEEEKFLLLIDAHNEAKFATEISKGELCGFHKRSHCKKRDFWYRMHWPETAPDAFYTYRTSKVPIMVLNDRDFLCTNAVHQIFFKERNLPLQKKRWIQLSLLSIYSLVEIEQNACVYGSNVLKIEPSVLKNIRVYCPDCAVDDRVVMRISAALQNGEPGMAVMEATRYIFASMEMEKLEQEELIARYKNITGMRTDNLWGMNFVI